MGEGPSSANVRVVLSERIEGLKRVLVWEDQAQSNLAEDHDRQSTQDLQHSSDGKDHG
jgi:hypothetical protein